MAAPVLVLIRGTPTTTTAESDHWHPGDPLLITVNIHDPNANQLLPITSPQITLLRYHL